MVAGEWPVDDVLELAGTALQTVAHVQAHRAGNLIGNVVSLTIAGVVVYTLLIKMQEHVITQLRGQTDLFDEDIDLVFEVR